MKKIFKSKKGITLVALVITIILLLILAGITINLVLGEGGLLNRAQGAADTQKQAEVREQIELMLSDYVIARNVYDKKLLDYLNEQEEKQFLDAVIPDEYEESGIIIVEKDGYEFSIRDSDLKIIDMNKGGSIRAKVEAKIYQTTGEEYIEGTTYEELVIKVTITNATDIEKIDSIEITDPDGTTTKGEIEEDNSASFTITSGGRYAIKVVLTKNKITTTKVVEVSIAEPVMKAESLYAAVAQINKNGIFAVQVEEEIYKLHMYVLEGNITFDGENTVDGAALQNKTYVFGDSNDISKSNSDKAENTVVVKVNGDITIENGAIVEPVSGDFGGPKGFVIYTDQQLSMNNGTIRNVSGCNADSQNVYLYKNSDNSYEMISKEVVAGGTGSTITKGAGRGSIFATSPNKGTDGRGRQTGGGGAGYAGIGNNSNLRGNLVATSGSGAAGNSWSGGAGGGGAAIAANGNNATVTAGSALNCIGGNGACSAGNDNQYSSSVNARGYGGSGNGVGKGYAGSTTSVGVITTGSLNASYNGVKGVGGVIVLYCNTLNVENANIIANGAAYSGTTYGNAYTSATGSNGTIFAAGGGSGGGSVNVFYNHISSSNIDTNLTIDVLGKGTGGNGTYNVGNISTGIYQSLKTSN